MRYFKLPDGRFFEIPDNPSEEFKAQFKQKLNDKFPDYYGEKTPEKQIEKTWFGFGEDGVGHVGEIVKGIPRGLGETALSGLEGLAQLFDPGNDSDITTALGDFKDSYHNLDWLKPKEGYEDALSTNFGQGLGSMGAFVGAATIGGPITLGGLAVGSGVSQQADNIARSRAEGKDISVGQEILSEIGGGLIGTSEILVPRYLSNLLKKMPKGKASALIEKLNIRRADADGKPLGGFKDYVIGGTGVGLLEGGQEFAASIGQNLISQGVYDADIPLMESAWDELTVGGMVGFASDAMIRAAGRRSISNSYVEEQALEQDKKDKEQIKITKENNRKYQEGGQRQLDLDLLPDSIEDNDIIETNRGPVRISEINNYEFTSSEFTNLDDQGNPLPTRIDTQDTASLISIKQSFERNLRNADKLIKAGTFTQEEINNQKNDLQTIDLALSIQGRNNGSFVESPTPPQIYDIRKDENGMPIPNANGGIDIIGVEDNIVYDTANDIETAYLRVMKLSEDSKSNFIIDSSKNALSINGLLGNGTAERIGHRVYDPVFTEIDARAIANADEKIGIGRQKQAKIEQEIIDKENEFMESPEGQLQLERDLYNLVQQMEGVPRTPSFQEIQEYKTKRLKDKLARANVVPIEGTQVYENSQLGLLWKKAEALGLNKKPYYSIEEAKQLLDTKDFDSLMTGIAETRFQINKQQGRLTPSSRQDKKRILKRIGGKLDLSKKGFQNVFDAKNIDVDFNSPAFQYFAKTLGGANKLSEMTEGQKLAFMSKISMFPRFDTKTKLPDYSPKPYSANQVNQFYQMYRGKRFTNKDIKLGIKNPETGADLTTQEVNQFKKDLINSGRAKKLKNNQTKMISNFKSVQEKRSESYNFESDQEYSDRLKRSTALTEEEIQQKVDTRKNNNDVLLLEDKSEQSINRKYKLFFDALRERLDQYGLKDVAINLTDDFKGSFGLREVDGEVYFDTTNETYLDTKRDKTITGLYDRPLEAMFLHTTRADPNNELTDAEYQDSLMTTLDHETIHALISLGVLKEKEFQILLRDAKRILPKKVQDEIRKAYKKESPTIIDEELVARFFEETRKQERQPSPKSKRLIQKVLDFFTSIRNSIVDAGFTTSRTIFNDIVAGKIGSRERDQALNMQRVRAEQQAPAQAIVNMEEKIKSTLETPTYSRASDEDRIYQLEQVIQGKKGQLRTDQLSQLTIKKLQEDIFRLEAEQDLIRNRPTFNRAGLTPEQLLYAGDIEKEVYNLWLDTDGNPTAQDFRELFAKLHGKRNTRNHKFKDYSEYKRIVREGYEKGYNDRWYEDWGINIPNLVGTANMHEFSAIFGITSAQATPEINLKSTLRAMIIARQIDPVKNPKKFINALRNWGRGNDKIKSIAMRNTARLKAIQRFYELGVFEREGSSQKTTTYGLETLMAMQGKFTPFMVADRHMIRQYGLDEKVSSATESEYRIMQAINALLATENYITNGEPNTFTPSQVQALMWADQRFEGETADRIANEGSYESAERYANPELKELRDMENAGTFSKENSLYNYFISPPRYSSSTKTNVFDTGAYDAMWDSILNSAPQVVFNFKSGMSRGYLPSNLDAPITFKAFRRYQERLLQSITSGGKIKFLRDLGIAHEITMSAATWDGDLTPSMVIQLPGLDPQSQSAVTALLTDALMQDGASLQMPNSKGSQSGLLITKSTGKRFNVGELTSIQKQLSSIQRDGKPLNFTILPTDKSGIALIDPKSYSEDYTTQDALDFVTLIKPVLDNTGMELKSYGQDTQLFQYGESTSNAKGTRGALQKLGNRIGFIESSDLQRNAIRDVYLPAYRVYKEFAEEIGFTPNNTEPYLQENSAVEGINRKEAELIEAVATARERVRTTPRGYIPRINHRASPLAIKTALDLEKGTNKESSFTRPVFSKSVGEEFESLREEIEGSSDPNGTKPNSLASVVEEAFEEENIRSVATRLKTEIIDALHTVEKGVRVAGRLDPQTQELNERAISGVLQALRYTGQARSLFNQVLKTGAPKFIDELGNVIDKGARELEGGIAVPPREDGGLIEIFAPLFANPEVDLETLFKLYAISRRSVRLNKEGKEVPVSEEFIKQADQIIVKHKIIEEVYNKWQAFNNEIIDFAVQGGILSSVITKNQLIQNMLKGDYLDNKWDTSQLNEAQLKKMELEDLISYAESLGADTRGTAQVWKDNSDYYPFYRNMQAEDSADKQLSGPKVASGFLQGNPLGIELKGSKAEIEPTLLEVIGRNTLSILTAASKNEGMQRLAKHYEKVGLAHQISAKDAGQNPREVIHVFENGIKKYYKVFDAVLIEGLQSMGIYDAGGFMTVVGGASSILRETVTRDPGFILKNMLRDTVSVWATSGAPITPFVDTFKNFNADLTKLEQAGIIGGYDAARDREDIVKLIERELKAQGIDENNSTDPIDTIVNIWDWLGRQTTKSDGATRKAVWDVVLENTNDIVEANYQALEIINFNRRGANPLFRLVTTAIPFLNARLQGLDVLGRALRGQYSALPVESASAQQLDGARKAIMFSTLLRMLLLAGTTGIYYALMSDTEEYKQERLQVRDDNYLIPNIFNLIEGVNLPAHKVPIPFEIGVLTKLLPERVLDFTFGETDAKELEESTIRAGMATFKIDPFGFQIVKPLMEAIRNKNTFTGNDIVPSWMERQLLPQEQYTRGTSEVARLIGQGLNISPLKIDHVMRGYGGTIGTYIIQMTDMLMRQVTDREFIAPDVSDAPFIRTILANSPPNAGGGLQEQFYELKQESLRFQTTVNKLKKEGRGDELQAYFKNNEGLASTRKAVLRLDKYMKQYRKVRRRIELDESLSAVEKRDRLKQLDIERNIRLAFVPDLKKQSDLRGWIGGLLRN